MMHSLVHSFWFSFFSLFEVVNLVEPVYGLLLDPYRLGSNLGSDYLVWTKLFMYLVFMYSTCCKAIGSEYDSSLIQS